MASFSGWLLIFALLLATLLFGLIVMWLTRN